MSDGDADHARWSCLYEGVVCHRRHEPIEHTFRYRVFMAYVDLDEVDELVAAHRPLWSDRIAAPVRMRRGDYYGEDQAVPLVEAIRALVQKRTGRRPVRVRLLTNLRMFGHCFNPVSFYYCFDREERLQAVVAEVTSTPWGERHAYVMEAESGRFVELFELMLDDTLMYSCALFPTPQASLREAQLHKLEAICDDLNLRAEDHVVEIGTGWGGFALHAASNCGCRVTTTTISPQQHALAVARVRQMGLEDRVTVLLRDYRHLRGRYDKLVSIAMIEAVGWLHFDTFFRFEAGAERLCYDEGFRRLWRLYLSYCEGGFRERRIEVGQLLLGKSGAVNGSEAARQTFDIAAA